MASFKQQAAAQKEEIMSYEEDLSRKTDIQHALLYKRQIDRINQAGSSGDGHAFLSAVKLLESMLHPYLDGQYRKEALKAEEEGRLEEEEVTDGTVNSSIRASKHGAYTEALLKYRALNDLMFASGWLFERTVKIGRKARL